MRPKSSWRFARDPLVAIWNFTAGAYWRWAMGRRGWANKALAFLPSVIVALILVSAVGSSSQDEPPSSTTNVAAVEGDAGQQQEASLPKYIEGLAAVDVTKNLENRGLTCRGPTRGGEFVSWFCEFEAFGGLVIYNVEVIGRSPTQIVSVDASVSNATTGSTEAIASDFLGYVATIPYKDAQQSRSRRWVQENLANVSGAEMVAGSAKFKLTGTERARFLEIVAAGAVSP